MSNLMPKVFRTSKTRVGKLQSFKTEKPSAKEPEVNKEEVTVVESSLGDVFQDIYGESGTQVKPDEARENSASKPHVRPDDVLDDFILGQDEPPAAKKQYSGEHVQEGISITQASEVESSDLDDLISQVMDIPADGDNPPPSSPKHPTSTPSKDYGDDADFGDGLSLIRGDDEGFDVPAEKGNKKESEKDEDRGGRSGDRDETSGKPMAYRDSFKPSSDNRSTSTISYSSKFVPSIPDSFYKEIQSRLEDLIFKFECLDNEYAALQKISHSIRVETTDVKKKFTSED